MIKKHQVLWAEALCVGVVCVLHPRVLGWVDYFVPYLTLVFLVLLAMYEESRAANKKVPKVAFALTLLAFIMFYAAPFFPALDFSGRWGGDSNLLGLIGWFSFIFGFFIWKGNTYGTLDDQTSEK